MCQRSREMCLGQQRNKEPCSEVLCCPSTHRLCTTTGEDWSEAASCQLATGESPTWACRHLCTRVQQQEQAFLQVKRWLFSPQNEMWYLVVCIITELLQGAHVLVCSSIYSFGMAYDFIDSIGDDVDVVSDSEVGLSKKLFCYCVMYLTCLVIKMVCWS
jgi:hypothetical protein